MATYPQHQLGLAIAIAADAHKDDTCLAGETYSLHWIKVMHDVRHHGHLVMAAAAMHDVFEDKLDLKNVQSDYWDAEIKFNDFGYDFSVFDPSVIEMVKSVTKAPGETYGQFIMRCAKNPGGRKIKLADLKHNSDLRRMPLHRDIGEKDLARARKYRISTIYLNRVERGETPASIAELDK